MLKAICGFLSACTSDATKVRSFEGSEFLTTDDSKFSWSVFPVAVVALISQIWVNQTVQNMGRLNLRGGADLIFQFSDWSVMVWPRSANSLVY